MKRSILLFLLMFGLFSQLRAEVNFLRGPLAEALKKAGAEKKPVMIDFITDWCRWCDTLERNTYSDEGVAGFINANLVPIKIDAEKGEGIGIAKEYGVHAYPTILLVHADGQEIDRLLGYMPPEPFMKSLRDYVRGENTLASLKAALERSPADPQAQYLVGKKYSAREDPAGAEPYFRKLLQLDPSDRLHHAEEAHYSLAMNALHQSKDTGPLTGFVKHYPESPMAGDALSSLVSFSIKQKKGKEARRYLEEYLARTPDDFSIMNNYAWNCAEQMINLDHAAEIAARAVTLTKSDGDKAMVLDTEAAVEFARGRRDEAIALEEQAVGLLKNANPKQRKPYDEALEKYRGKTAAQ